MSDKTTRQRRSLLITFAVLLYLLLACAIALAMRAVTDATWTNCIGLGVSESVVVGMFVLFMLEASTDSKNSSSFRYAFGLACVIFLLFAVAHSIIVYSTETTYKILNILVLLSVWLATWHLAMASFLPRNKRFWKSTDYLWMCLGVIGLLGMAQKIRHDTYTTDLSAYEQRLHIAQNRVISVLESEVKSPISSTIRFLKSSALPEFAVPERLDRESIKESLNSLSDQFEKEKEPLRQIIEILRKDTAWTSQNLPERLSGIEILNNDSLTHRLAQLSQIEGSEPSDFGAIFRERSPIENWWLVVSPLFLVAGLALRITRVSAEIFGFAE